MQRPGKRSIMPRLPAGRADQQAQVAAGTIGRKPALHDGPESTDPPGIAPQWQGVRSAQHRPMAEATFRPEGRTPAIVAQQQSPLRISGQQPVDQPPSRTGPFADAPGKDDQRIRSVHPDHGGDQTVASTAVFELAEARKILAATPPPP